MRTDKRGAFRRERQGKLLSGTAITLDWESVGAIALIALLAVIVLGFYAIAARILCCIDWGSVGLIALIALLAVIVLGFYALSAHRNGTLRSPQRNGT
jgi:hypothetical protein